MEDLAGSHVSAGWQHGRTVNKLCGQLSWKVPRVGKESRMGCGRTEERQVLFIMRERVNRWREAGQQREVKGEQWGHPERRKERTAHPTLLTRSFIAVVCWISTAVATETIVSPLWNEVTGETEMSRNVPGHTAGEQQRNIIELYFKVQVFHCNQMTDF